MAEFPPLNAMRAFEVAARVGSFVQAGAELGVTAAAVSQQVKGLEEYLGKRLFLRQGNRIVLTDAGRSIYPRLEQALGDISAVAGELRQGPSRARLVVSVLPSLSELWLIPKLVGFEAAVEVRVEDDPVVLARDGIDLRVTYGAHYYPDHSVVPLFNDSLIAIAAPGRFGGFPDLEERDFIHTDWGPAYATQPSWAVWWRALGRGGPNPAQGLRVGLSSMAVTAAREGLGVALVPRAIAARDLAAGRLVQLAGPVLPMPWDYVLVYPNALSRRRSLMALVAHLRSGL